LYIFSFDDRGAEILNKLDLPKTTIITLKEFEDEKLLEVKPERTRAEYCWTCTSSTILYCIERFGLDMCTYLDADMLFFDSPKVLFDEMGDKSVMIIEHRFHPDHDKSWNSGKYCVQFMVFRNSEQGMKVLRWWREACLDWCYARLEDGKFGDQKYLDDWPQRFEGIHELKNHGGGVAPWNVSRYDFFYKQGELYGKDLISGEEFKIIFFHFHNARLYNILGKVRAKYFIRNNKPTEGYFYREYEKILNITFQNLLKIEPGYALGFADKFEYFREKIRESIPESFKKIVRKIAYDKKNQS
jgi:hypothetical protein